MVTNNDDSNLPSGRELAQEKHLANLAETIHLEFAKIEDYARRTFKHAYLAGRLLCEAKRKAGHGNWLNWFESQKFVFKEVTAQRYMRLYRGWPELQERLVELGNPSSLTDLSVDSALQLLSNPNKLKSSELKVIKGNSLTTETEQDKKVSSEILLQEDVSFIEGMLTPECLLNAAKAVLGCIGNSHIKIKLSALSSQSGSELHPLDADYRWLGRMFINPIRSPDLLEAVSQKLHFAFVEGEVSEAILLVPTQVDAFWYRQFRECARVHLVKPDEETGIDWVETLTAIYLGNRQELFFEIFKSIGDGYLPYRSFAATKR